MGHDWVRNDGGDWYCRLCHVVTAISVDPPADDQVFTPASLAAPNYLRSMAADTFSTYTCEEMQVWKIHAS
jgi:hypothetical protein